MPAPAPSSARVSCLAAACGRFGAAAAAAALVAAGVTSVAVAAGVPWPAAKIADKVLLGAFALLYPLLARKSLAPLADAVGLKPQPGALSAALVGVCVTLAALAAADVAACLAGVRTTVPADALGVAKEALKALAIAPLLVVFEEGVFRGLLLSDLLRSGARTAAVVISAAVYAVLHQLHATPGAVAADGALGVGPSAVANLFAGLANVPARWPDVFGLFLFGVLLAVTRLRRGDVWLAMGLHAGGYIFLQTHRLLVAPVGASGSLWFGSLRTIDGVAGWIALAIVAAVVARARGPATGEHGGGGLPPARDDATIHP